MRYEMTGEDARKPLTLCTGCAKKAIKNDYAVEITTSNYYGDWTWRYRFYLLGFGLWFLRKVIGLDARFYMLTIHRGDANWKIPNENEALEETK